MTEDGVEVVSDRQSQQANSIRGESLVRLSLHTQMGKAAGDYGIRMEVVHCITMASDILILSNRYNIYLG